MVCEVLRFANVFGSIVDMSFLVSAADLLALTLGHTIDCAWRQLPIAALTRVIASALARLATTCMIHPVESKVCQICLHWT